METAGEHILQPTFIKQVKRLTTVPSKTYQHVFWIWWECEGQFRWRADNTDSWTCGLKPWCKQTGYGHNTHLGRKGSKKFGKISWNQYGVEKQSISNMDLKPLKRATRRLSPPHLTYLVMVNTYVSETWSWFYHGPTT